MGHEELQPEDIDVSISAFHGALKRTWHAFCGTTSIHGLKYTTDTETNRYIRFMWLLITLLMFLCAIAMVLTFYMEYRSNPTRMNAENDRTPISSLMFPPTTICAEAMYNINKSIKFLETLIMPNYTTVAEVTEVLHYVYGFVYDILRIEEKNIDMLEEILTLNKLSILDFINNLSWDCEDLMLRCRFMGKIEPCKHLFRSSQTYRGHCCSFNLNQTFSNFTYRHAYAGLRNGLSILLHYKGAPYTERSTYSVGFKILMQEMNTFPSAYSLTKFVPLKEETFVVVKPTEIFCSQAVKDLSFENRLCAFPHENKLEYFDIYTASNCELNCRIKNMLKFCNCYAYSYYDKRIKARVCSYKDLPCLAENFASTIGRFKKTQCTCYRNCETIEYSVQVSGVPLILDVPNIDTFYDDLKEDYSVVHIYLNSQVYRRLRHDLLSNMVTLVSNLGSAFSLFVGMSMISVVEIIYFFSIILNKFYRQEIRARVLMLQETQQHKAEGISNKQLELIAVRNGNDNLRLEDISN